MDFQIKIATVAIVIAMFSSCKQQDNNVQTDLAIPVSVEDVKTSSIKEFVTTTGTVNALKKVDLNSEIAGQYVLATNPLTGRPFKMGDKVKAGQTIIRIEDEEYENGIALDSKKLNLEISKQEYEKQKSLYEKGGVTLRDMRNSEVSMINAQYDFENAELKLAQMKVVAPFNGVIVDLPYFTPGTKIASGLLMVSMMDYSKLHMEINLPEKYIQTVVPKQDVFITNYTLPDDTLDAEITELSPAISTETRTFKGSLLVQNSELKLRPGMFVKADIVVESSDSTIVIDKDLIIARGKRKSVFVVDKKAARERRITTGLESKDKVEVTSGLNLNDRLIVKGFETLRNGSKVKVIK
ncbi:efflux RND transporter periplasmic adaptor subunit [Puteibacter caeruleilacunae]|nr:efflux RND transporter periplasmic adaptor subunit [Puteibacter caeruleilacunae]